MNAVPRFNLRQGQWVEFDGSVMRFERRGRDRERRIVFEGVDGISRDVSDSELLELQHGPARRLKLLTDAEASNRLAETGRPRVTFLAADLEDGDEARRRLDYMNAWSRAGRPARTVDSIADLVTSCHEERRATGVLPVESKAPSPRTVLRWISEWQASGCTIDGLIPQSTNRGNASDRLRPKARELLEHAVEDHYLVETKPTVVEVHAHVRRLFSEHNEALPPSSQLPVPTLSTVYRSVSRIDRYTLDCSRRGRQVADHKWRTVMSAPATVRHNEVWEVDHTLVDTVVLDDDNRMPIGRPWVTVTLDRHTRAITGFHIGFDPPGTFAAMECMRNAILPKDALLARHPGIAGSWPCMGTPEVLVPDQGREFKSHAFVNGCLQLGIALEYTPVLKAWYKGKIERFFRTLTISVFQRVPGTTFSSLFERNRESPPDTVAIITLNELREHVLRFIVEVYHRRTHRGLGVSPMEAWVESVRRCGMRSLPNPEHVLSAMSHVVWRVPQRYGIEFEGLMFNSPEVAALRIRPEGDKPVRIAVDPLDLTRVSFLDPRSQAFVEVPIVPAMRQRVTGVTLEKHKLARALQRANSHTLAGDDGLARAYTVIDDAARALGAARGQDNRRAAARHWDKLNAVKRPEDPPAFDIAASAVGITDGLFDDGVLYAGDPASAEEPRANPGDMADVAPPRRRRRENGRNDAAVGQKQPGRPAGENADQEDLDAMVRAMGMEAQRHTMGDGT